MAWKPLILPRPEHQDQAHITKEMISKLSSESILKKGYVVPSREPSPRNPIYLQSIRIGCSICHKEKRGTGKNFKNLWKLYYHCKIHHSLEMDFLKEDIMKIADLKLRGYLL